MYRRHTIIRRTARALALSRVVIAVVFLLAVWLEPSAREGTCWQPVAVLVGYGLWATVLAVIATRSWWWEFRLAWPAHLCDIAVFVVAVTLTETRVDDFRSPFMAFTAFLLISAALRWGELAVGLSAGLLIGAYGATIAVLETLHLSADPYQAARRLIYMIALSIMMVWLSVDRRVAMTPPLPEPDGVPGARHVQVIATILAHARAAFNARHAAIAITREEEPWIDLFRDDDGLFVHERIGPGAMTEDFAPDFVAALFDLTHGRRIVVRADMQLVPVSGQFDHALARACGIPNGLIAGFASAGGHGQIVISGIANACIDDLLVLAAMVREVGQALDREDMAALGQSIAVSDVRTALARDLHDSVAQFLAGTLFRLEALRRWIRDGHDPDPEIVAIKDALRAKQGHVNALIERLRRGIDGDRDTDLVAELGALVGELGHHWQIATAFRAGMPVLDVSIALAHELRQVVREAVANAARHGGCNAVELSLDRSGEGWLKLAIADNGSGFPQEAKPAEPRSIAERLASLGGRLRVGTAVNGGALLDIAVPLGTTQPR